VLQLRQPSTTGMSGMVITWPTAEGISDVAKVTLVSSWARENVTSVSSTGTSVGTGVSEGALGDGDDVSCRRRNWGLKKSECRRWRWLSVV
jgi:hypothetical protein